MSSDQLVPRDQIDDRYKINLSELYPTEALKSIRVGHSARELLPAFSAMSKTLDDFEALI